MSLENFDMTDLEEHSTYDIAGTFFVRFFADFREAKLKAECRLKIHLETVRVK